MKVKLTPEQLKEIFLTHVHVRRLTDGESVKWESPEWIDIGRDRYQWGFPKGAVVEAEPIEEVKWEKKFRDFTVEALKKQGYKPYPDHIYDWTDIFKMGYLDDLFSFIRAEVIEKIFTEIVYHCCPDTEMESEIDKIKSKWLGGGR